MISPLKNLPWHSFLARPRLPSAGTEMLRALCAGPILITGAGGSIASALSLRLGSHGARLILVESSESNLFALHRELDTEGAKATFVLGDITDSSLLDEIFSIHAPRMVFHAAAYKQVPLLEEHPMAAIANNVFGTAELATAVNQHGAHVVLLSTDKAVEPASVMGATKRITEYIVLRAGGTVLRLGNVLASSDSVAEVFARQIAEGGPITVTHPGARRYFLTIDEAVDLLLVAAAEPSRPALLVPDLPPSQFIADLAQFMARTLAHDREISIAFTHPRAGDKETEQLWSQVEKASPAQTRGLFSIDSPLPEARALDGMLSTLRTAIEARDLAAALDTLVALVPDYTPGSTVSALAAGTRSKVSHE